MRIINHLCMGWCVDHQVQQSEIIGWFLARPRTARLLAISLAYYFCEYVVQVNGKDPLEILSNAKKMRVSEGMWIKECTPLCSIAIAQPVNPLNADADKESSASTSQRDGTESFVLTGGVNGKLLTCNHRLLAEPQLLKSRPHDQAYIAILAVQYKEVERLKSSLHTPEEFCGRRGISLHQLRPRLFTTTDWDSLLSNCKV